MTERSLWSLRVLQRTLPEWRWVLDGWGPKVTVRGTNGARFVEATSDDLAGALELAAGQISEMAQSAEVPES